MKPLNLKTHEVQAVLSGEKTMHRVVIKPQPSWGVTGFRGSLFVKSGLEDGHGREMKPPFNPGDILYVKETWTPIDTEIKDSTDMDLDGIPLDEYWVQIGFKDGGDKWVTVSDRFYDRMDDFIDEMEESGTRWKSPSTMPNGAARIFLRVKSVKAQRLQDIAPDDIRKEGKPNSAYALDSSCHQWWKELWSFIHGKESWNANPWVWVIEFERVDKTEVDK